MHCKMLASVLIIFVMKQIKALPFEIAESKHRQKVSSALDTANYRDGESGYRRGHMKFLYIAKYPCCNRCVPVQR